MVHTALTSPPDGLVASSGDARNGNAPSPVPSTTNQRPRIRGKFFEVGGEKIILRGVTYGPLCGGGSEDEYRTPDVVRRDFSDMRQNGINTVRTYTVPPIWFLDLAGEQGLRVIVGLPWEQHIAFLNSRESADGIATRLRQAVRACKGHPAVLAYSIGNEIPSHVVRWYGHRKIEQYLHRLYLAVMAEDPDGLVTYVNYPSTEYLELPFLDFLSFNVFLESPESFAGYIGRLQTMAGNRPLVMSEVGLDARRHGEKAQAQALSWQIRDAFRGGCAGLFVFSWTDEWHRGGEDIVDWEFGLTGKTRRPKPALAAVREAFSHLPFQPQQAWPGISVVVCTYNGSATLQWCLEGLCALDYPDYEMIVVDDGSADHSAEIAREFSSRGVRLIRIPNGGLSNARNVGLAAATRQIVAYLDDDARPDTHWLQYLGDSLRRSDHVGVGGPNIPPCNASTTSTAVALAPGGPVHVLLTDEIAEHIPGCNMAFRKECLEAVGGFDSQFRIAGDDVDLCWRLQARGWTLGFNPAAMVWHRRRPSVAAYWKQQVNYGRAEADLEQKWPEKYNAVGHFTWSGRLYRGTGLLQAISWWARRRIYHGTWGSAMFQSVYHAPPSWIGCVPTMPEWYLLVFLLAALGALGQFWRPLYVFLPLCALAAAAPAWHSVMAARAAVAVHRATRRDRLKLWATTSLLHVLQPMARLCGRAGRGLTPWRSRHLRGFRFPLPLTLVSWSPDSSHWRSHEERLKALEATLVAQGAVVVRGGNFDRWDVEVRGGAFGSARSCLLIEEHGCGRQLLRLRANPCWSSRSGILAGVLALIGGIAAIDGAPLAAAFFAALALLLCARALYEAGTAIWAISTAMPAETRSICGKTPSAVAGVSNAARFRQSNAEEFKLSGVH